MADYATKNAVQEIVDKAVEDLSEVISQFATNVDARFNNLESDISELKDGVADFNSKYDRLLSTLDAFIKRIDDFRDRKYCP